MHNRFEGVIRRLGLFIFTFSFFIFTSFSYEHIITEEPLSIHVVKVDPQKYDIFPRAAVDQVLGRETVPSIAKRYSAVVAVNGGFFRIGTTFDGMPSGILKIDGEWYGLPLKPRAAIGWGGVSKPLVDQLLAECTVQVGSYNIPCSAINRPRFDHDLVVYNDRFNITTLTNPGGVEVEVIGNKCHSVRESGSSVIPRGGYVVSAGSKNDFRGIFDEQDEVNYHVKILPQSGTTSSEEWNDVAHIVGGVPVLVRNGEIVDDFSVEKTMPTFLTKKHARTAIGLQPDGLWVFVVVDGKQEKLSVGMTMSELAEFMFGLGCCDALNLDGGGSTTLVVDDKIVNSPYGDEDEDAGQKILRRVSDGIFVVPR